MSSFSDYDPISGGCSAQDQESLEESTHDYYTGNYTSDRPPHLNDDNFSSTQPHGSAYQPRRPPSVYHSELSSLHVTTNDGTNNSSHSIHTSNTLKAGDVFSQRSYINHYINQDYFTPKAPALTTDTVAALNYTNDTNVHNWLLGAECNRPDDATNNWSNDYVQASHSSKSRSSVDSGLSWGLADDAQQAESINGIGGWQADIAANPETFLARTIAEEDTRDRGH